VQYIQINVLCARENNLASLSTTTKSKILKIKKSKSKTLWATLGGLGIESSLYDDTGSVLERFISIFISLGGVLVTAMLLGLISDAIGEYMDGLRQGRSDVIESGHTLILGRSDKLMEVIRQLSLANESEGGGVVVVLNETGKEEVEAEVCIFMYVCVITPPPPTFTLLFV
jgi:hypothetical protein